MSAEQYKNLENSFHYEVSSAISKYLESCVGYCSIQDLSKVSIIGTASPEAEIGGVDSIIPGQVDAINLSIASDRANLANIMVENVLFDLDINTSGINFDLDTKELDFTVTEKNELLELFRTSGDDEFHINDIIFNGIMDWRNGSSDLSFKNQKRLQEILEQKTAINIELEFSNEGKQEVISISYKEIGFYAILSLLLLGIFRKKKKNEIYVYRI